MYPPVRDTFAPLQSLPVQTRLIGEAHAGPHFTPDVLDPAFDPALGLRPVGLAQRHLETHPQGEVQHALVPDGLLFLIPGHRRWLTFAVMRRMLW